MVLCARIIIRSMILFLVLLLLLLFLGTARLSIMLVRESVFVWFREWVFLRFAPPGQHDGVVWVNVRRKKRGTYRGELRTWRDTVRVVRVLGDEELSEIVTERGAVLDDRPERFTDFGGRVRAESMIGELFSCVWCLSVWVGLFQIGLFLLSPVLSVGLNLVLGLSLFSVFVDSRL